MKRKRFKEIIWELRFTLSNLPGFCDRFWEVHGTSSTVMQLMTTIISTSLFQAPRQMENQQLPVNVFPIILAMTEFNVYIILKNIVHSGKENMEYLEFCPKLAWLFIGNEGTIDEAKMERLAKRIREQFHNNASAPHFARYFISSVCILGAMQRYQS